MRFFFTLLFFLIIPVCTFASVLSEPTNSFELLSVEDPSASETYYGKLTGYPHTYEFLVKEGGSFSAVLSSAGIQSESGSLSLILVRGEKRGVSEIGRVTGKDIQWNYSYNHALALTLREGEILEAELEEGFYKLEVSTPDNFASYKLDFNEGGDVSYKELFLIRKTFDLSYFSVLFAPRIYIPALTLLAFLYYRKKKKHA